MSEDRTGRHPLLRAPLRALALACVACVVVAAALAGCGGSGASPSPSASTGPRAPLRRATLILDFTPNAVHAGIYRALAAGYYRAQGIDLRVVSPSATTDTLKLIDARSAQFGLADGSDVAALIAHGGDAQAVAAIAQRPLGGLIASASEQLRSPADLQGRTVGVTGVPSDTAVLDTEVRHAGGDPRRVHVVTIGFDGARALAAGRIGAFTGFIPADGVQLQVSGHPIAAFALDRYGGPAYPGLVAFTTRGLIASQPALVRGFVAATVHGYEDTLADPGRSLRELLAANPTLARGFARASLNAYLPLFAAGAPFGTLRSANVRAMSDWMLANRLIGAPVAPVRYGTNAFLPGR
jgi:NitT/TauT family transport system substrate-binding protein/putative hydroxymethylpyrimidine transport system substrate-binding protein